MALPPPAMPPKRVPPVPPPRTIPPAPQGGPGVAGVGQAVPPAPVVQRVPPAPIFAGPKPVQPPRKFHSGVPLDPMEARKQRWLMNRKKQFTPQQTPEQQAALLAQQKGLGVLSGGM